MQKKTFFFKEKSLTNTNIRITNIDFAIVYGGSWCLIIICVFENLLLMRAACLSALKHNPWMKPEQLIYILNWRTI